MGINPVVGYGNSYDNYQIKPLQSDIEKQNSIQEPQKKVTQDSSPALAAIERRPNISIEDVSLTYHPGIESELVGTDSDIKSLDVQKAISDMKKDSILEEYQYFVGSSFAMGAVQQSQDGTVIAK